MFLYCITTGLVLCWLCNQCLFFGVTLYKPIQEPCVLFLPVSLNTCFFTYKLSLSGEVGKMVVFNMILLSCWNEEVRPNTFSFCRRFCFFYLLILCPGKSSEKLAVSTHPGMFPRDIPSSMKAHKKAWSTAVFNQDSVQLNKIHLLIFFSVGVEDKASVLQNSLLQWMAQRFLDKGISHLYGFSFSFSFLHVEGAEIEQWNTEWSLQVSFAIRCPEFFSIEKIDSESSALLQQRVGGTQAFLSDPRREGSLNRVEKCRSFWKTIRAVPGVEQLYKDKYSSVTEDAFPSMCYSTKA